MRENEKAGVTNTIICPNLGLVLKQGEPRLLSLGRLSVYL